MKKQKNAEPTTMIDSKPLASFDLGNANAKIATACLKTEFRSIAGRLSKSRRFGEMKSPLVFTFEGETLVFGDDSRDLIDGEPVAYTDITRYTSGFYRNLFAAALWRSFQDAIPDGVLQPTVVCSIPVIEYANGRADEVKKNIAGSYRIEAPNGKSVLCAYILESELLIIPEGAGSYYEALAEGDIQGDTEVAILDIGFYTTDLVIFNRGNYVAGSARTCKHGVQQVARSVHQFLNQKYGYTGDLWAVDQALASGAIQVGNQTVRIADECGEGYENLLSDILNFYYTSKGSRMPGAVRLFGGGAPGLNDCLPQRLGSAGWQLGHNARRGNVDGALKFLLKRQEKRGNV